MGGVVTIVLSIGRAVVLKGLPDLEGEAKRSSDTSSGQGGEWVGNAIPEFGLPAFHHHLPPDHPQNAPAVAWLSVSCPPFVCGVWLWSLICALP